MESIIEKLSSYNIFNYLLPGVIFVVFCKQHAILTEDTGIKVYFAHPHSPWERGSNEKYQWLAAPVSTQGGRSLGLLATRAR